ncbi:MAG: hypothetical protein CFH43_01102 [Proteobacteria bacterium]|nr:MAG: hypothetical protein CFH43_01102 [Pseudomonadota bacterium]
MKKILYKLTKSKSQRKLFLFSLLNLTAITLIAIIFCINTRYNAIKKFISCLDGYCNNYQELLIPPMFLSLSFWLSLTALFLCIFWELINNFIHTDPTEPIKPRKVKTSNKVVSNEVVEEGDGENKEVKDLTTTQIIFIFIGCIIFIRVLVAFSRQM